MNNLCTIRLSRGYSIRNLARISGVSSKTIMAVEHEIVDPGEGVKARLAEALAVEIGNLFPAQDPGPVPRQIAKFGAVKVVSISASLIVACPHCYSTIPFGVMAGFKDLRDLRRFSPEIHCTTCGADFKIRL